MAVTVHPSNLRCSIDGDHLMITGPDFVNLQESEAVFMQLLSGDIEALTKLEAGDVPVHHPLCFRGKGGKDGRCNSYMAVSQHCEACKKCPLRPEGL